MPQAKKFTTSPKIPMNKLVSDELFGSTYGMLWVANYSHWLCNTQSVNILTVIRIYQNYTIVHGCCKDLLWACGGLGPRTTIRDHIT